MLDWPNLDTIRRQAEGIIAFFEQRQITVHLIKPKAPPPPNFLFQRDLYWMTPSGAMMARMGAAQRAGEEPHMALGLSQIGVPIVASPLGNATVEGADALWLDPETVLVGTGMRTNAEGLETVSTLAKQHNASTIPIPLPAGIQHLLGVINFLDKDRVAIWEGRTPQALIDVLQERNVRCLVLPDGPEMRTGRAMNWVCLGPRAVVMPSNCPKTKDILVHEGISVDSLDVSSYIQAGGGLGCLTGIAGRQAQ